jgi:predicted helicase
MPHRRPKAYRYRLGSRSAVEWIIDRYQVKTDKNSGTSTSRTLGPAR